MLSVCACDITDQSMRSLSEHCPALRYLSQGCLRLVRLYLDSCAKITDVGVVLIAQQCPLIEFIDLTDCTLLTDVSVTAFSVLSKNIQGILIDGCDHISVECLDYVRITHPNMTFSTY